MNKDLTPKSYQLLEQLYQGQKPGMKTCAETGDTFEITEDMYNMYKKLGVPLPTTAPHVRLRRLRAHMGGIELFPRKTMGTETVVSMYDPESHALVLSPEEWRADTFSPEKYGQAIDPQQSFFDQWMHFSRTVPRPTVSSDPDSENCSWSIYDVEFKECYATFGGVNCKHLLYGDMCIDTSNSLDLAFMVQTEWSYECIQGFQCSQAFFSDFCVSCLNVYFSFGCRNSSNLFACVNLDNKQYCILNVQYTKEEYFKKISQFDLSDIAVVKRLQKEAWELWKQGYYRTEVNFNSERSVGDDVISSVDTYGISTFQTERLYNSFDTSYVKDSCDITTSSNLELSVNTVACDGYGNKMTISCHGCTDVEYSELCVSCEHCFGCIGLKRKKYCIFNVQYTEEEYWKKLDEIKSAMIRRGEYGEFFPYRTSLFAYNTSHADTFFSLSRGEVEHLGARWYDLPKADSDGSKYTKMPEKLKDFDDSLLASQFVCEDSGRPYRIVEPELAFHKKFDIALPTQHPSVRRKNRYARMHGLTLRDDQCYRCDKSIVSRISPDLESKNVCDDCFGNILIENEVKLH